MRAPTSRNERGLRVALGLVIAGVLLVVGRSWLALAFALFGFLQGPMTEMVRSHRAACFQRMRVGLRIIVFTPLVFTVPLYVVFEDAFLLPLFAMWSSWSAGMTLFVKTAG